MITRRQFVSRSCATGIGVALAGTTGCTKNHAENTDAIAWGQRGLSDGQFMTPRAVVIDGDDQLFIVDKTGRIQIFDRDGNFIRCWRTPEVGLGKPCGLGLDNRNSLLVGDTHYHRVLFYSKHGVLDQSRTIGGKNGILPGQFGFVTDVVQDSSGNFYVGDYGEHDRIQKFSQDGDFIMEWGGQGDEPGKFLRPQGMIVDENGLLWVADACNHRVQVFDATGDHVRLVKIWGTMGIEPGQMRYPYGIAFVGNDRLLLCEWGNHRVQLFDLEGNPHGMWGSAGKQIRQLNQPWGLAIDSKSFVHILDTENHRVQRVHLSEIVS